MIETLKRNVIEAWLTASPKAAVKWAEDQELTERDIDGLFRMVESNGARLHELADVGGFLQGASLRLDASAYFRHAALMPRAGAVQSLFESRGIPDDMDFPTMIEWGIKPNAFSRVLNHVGRNATSLGKLDEFRSGAELPESYRDVVLEAALIDVRPQLLGVAYLSDRLNQLVKPAFFNGGRSSFARRKVEQLINAAAVVYGIEVPRVDGDPNLMQAVEIAKFTEFAGFGADMVHDAIAGYLAAPETDVHFDSIEVSNAASRFYRDGRIDSETQLFSIATRYYYKRGELPMAHAAASMGADLLSFNSIGGGTGREAAGRMHDSFMNYTATKSALPFSFAQQTALGGLGGIAPMIGIGALTSMPMPIAR